MTRLRIIAATTALLFATMNLQLPDGGVVFASSRQPRSLGHGPRQGNTGMMGEALGRAAYLCKKHRVDPRAIHEQHLDQFKQLLLQPTVAPPSTEAQAHARP